MICNKHDYHGVDSCPTCDGEMDARQVFGRHDDKNGDGLALPLETVQLAAPDGFLLGWCVVDANKRVLGYCMTERQAHQLADAANSAIPSAERATVERVVREHLVQKLRYYASGSFPHDLQIALGDAASMIEDAPASSASPTNVLISTLTTGWRMLSPTDQEHYAREAAALLKEVRRDALAEGEVAPNSATSPTKSELADELEAIARASNLSKSGCEVCERAAIALRQSPLPRYAAPFRMVGGKDEWVQVRFVSRQHIKDKPTEANPTPVRVIVVADLERVQPHALGGEAEGAGVK